MSERDHLRQSHNPATPPAQSARVSAGYAYTISRMSRSSERYSISPIPCGAGWNSAAVLLTPSRTPRFQMGLRLGRFSRAVLWRFPIVGECRMSAQDFRRQSHNPATQQSASVVKGYAYTISRMSRSSERYSISPIPCGAGWNSAAVLLTPSRTPRFQTGTGCRGCEGQSSGGSPSLVGAA